jgi:hypothetical protein
VSTTLTQVAKAPVNVFLTGSTGSLANNANALSAAIDPTLAAWGSYPRVRWVFTGTFATAPSPNSAVSLFYRLSTDATTSNFETDLGRSTTPVRPPAAVIALDTTNTTQVRVSEAVDLPAVPFEVILVNNASGQTISAGWHLEAVPITDIGN